jgi:nucleotide-binding universal stress UspA family protein
MRSERLDTPMRGGAARRLPVAARRSAPPGRWIPTGRRDDHAEGLIDEISSYLRSCPATATPAEASGGCPPRIRVLLPYSASAQADRAIDAMIRLAPVLRAEVRVLHIREYDTCRGARFFLSSHKEAVRLTVEAVSRLRRRGVAATGIVRAAPVTKVGRAILQEAAESQVSVILVGAHRRRFPLDYVRRNVVRHVLRRAPCAVLVVRTDPPEGARAAREVPEPGRRGGPDLPHAA